MITRTGEQPFIVLKLAVSELVLSQLAIQYNPLRPSIQNLGSYVLLMNGVTDALITAVPLSTTKVCD